MFNSADESIKDELRLLLQWYGSPVTLHTCVHQQNIWAKTSACLAKKRVSKSCFIVEPCFHHYALFGRVLICILGFNLNHALVIKRIEGLHFCYIHFSNVQYRQWVLKGRNTCFCICYCSVYATVRGDLSLSLSVSVCLSLSLYIYIYIYIYIYLFICKCHQI